MKIIRQAHKIFCKCDAIALLWLFIVFSVTVKSIISNKGVFSFWAYGDAQMLNGGISFARTGFIKNNFLPLINPGPTHSLIPNNGPNGRYFHYPALHAILIGIVVKLIDLLRGNTDTLPETIKNYSQYLFSIISLASFYLNYYFLKFFVQPKTALAGMVALTVFGFYTKFGISLCDQPMHYFFLSLIFVVVTKILLTPTYEFLKKRNQNILVASVVFISARNSIETPIVLLVLISTCIIVQRAQPYKSSILWIAKFVIFPICFAISIQFFQSYLEYSNLSAFADHWTNLASSRFSPRNFGSRHMILVFLKYLHPLTAGLLLVIVFWLIKTSKRSQSNKTHQIGSLIILSYFLGLVALVVILPQQMIFMHHYSSLYFTHTLILGVAVTLGKINWSPKLLNLVLIVFLVASVIVQTKTEKSEQFLSFKSVFNKPLEGGWWASSPSSWIQISMLGYPIISEFSKTMTTTDIGVLTNDFVGNSGGEANPIVEFYSQRHLITRPSTEVSVCDEVQDRVSELSHIFYFNNELEMLDTETCR